MVFYLKVMNLLLAFQQENIGMKSSLFITIIAGFNCSQLCLVLQKHHNKLYCEAIFLWKKMSAKKMSATKQSSQYISTFCVALLQKFSLVLKQPVSIGYVSWNMFLYEIKWSVTGIISDNQKLLLNNYWFLSS